MKIKENSSTYVGSKRFRKKPKKKNENKTLNLIYETACKVGKDNSLTYANMNVSYSFYDSIHHSQTTMTVRRKRPPRTPTHSHTHTHTENIINSRSLSSLIWALLTRDDRHSHTYIYVWERKALNLLSSLLCSRRNSTVTKSSLHDSTSKARSIEHSFLASVTSLRPSSCSSVKVGAQSTRWTKCSRSKHVDVFENHTVNCIRIAHHFRRLSARVAC